jgi:hypothetical protein
MNDVQVRIGSSPDIFAERNPRFKSILRTVGDVSGRLQPCIDHIAGAEEAGSAISVNFNE